MIAYAHASQTQPPPWIAGAVDLCSGASRLGIMHAVGDPWLLRLPEAHEAQPVELEGGWLCWQIGELDPTRLVRAQGWCRLRSVSDCDDRQWPSPLLLSRGGERCYTVKYGGPEWMPVLTKVQAEAEHIARLARDALAAASVTGELDDQASAAWTARLLSTSLHVTPEVLAKLGLIDDPLIIGVLQSASGVTVSLASDSEESEGPDHG